MTSDCLKFNREEKKENNESDKDEEKEEQKEIKIDISQSMRLPHAVVVSGPNANAMRGRYEAPIIEQPPVICYCLSA
jgi:hypothetical protein